MVSAVKDKWGNDVNVAAAIFNASGKFARKPFLELEAEDMQSGIDGTIMGAFNFSQCLLPLLLKHEKGEYPATVVFTGATASLKGSARFASFAGPKFALRAMAQSLAREFGPQGVHVAHAVIDGVIDIPRTKGWDMGEGGKISPEAVSTHHGPLRGALVLGRVIGMVGSLSVKDPCANAFRPQIADAYWHLHTQPKTAFTFEIDIRPSVEKW